VARRSTILLCDDDRTHTQSLARGLAELGYAVETTRCHAEAFAIACSLDLDALVAAPFLRDGSALVLPASLGIRRPPLLLLASRISERLSIEVVQRVGFDAQLTKVLDARVVDRMLWLARARGGRARSAAPSEVRTR
jgi:DNA-binding response OmpR family regulator